ncbi:MAG: hypothetical protein Kow0058_03470 [Roseovarius sp.]
MIDAGVLNALIGARRVDELWAKHVRLMTGYGFDRLIYGFTRFMNGKRLGDPRDFVLLSNHAPAYLRGFIDGGLYASAPMLLWALENDGAQSWSLVQEREAAGRLSAAERQVLAFNRAMGVVAGYSISFDSMSARTKGVIALTARAGLDQAAVDAIWARHGADILLLNNLMHLRVLTLPHAGPGRRLTERQIEVLEWIGDGKTVRDAAQLMGVTAATVDKHLRLARETLGVATTAQAVLKAAMQNQIFLPDRLRRPGDNGGDVGGGDVGGGDGGSASP